MPVHNNINLSHLLTLRTIASWQLDGIENGSSEITARVPSLQRGAVWEPQQVEMLWDSIMRGFPIGSIVIAKKIAQQNDKHQPTLASYSVPSKDTSHHILDGQQRCNAIAWGFVDPWNENLSDDIVLWLDIKPGDRLKNTTRKYLTRVTTKAHPWGFQHGDQSENLRTEQRDKFMEKMDELKLKKLPEKFRELLISDDKNKKIKRPSPKVTMPFEANFPVPMFLLFRYFKDDRLDWNKLAQDDWMEVITVWSGLSVIDVDENNRKHIELGLKMAEQACMIALQVPELINEIDDIEQIFQRLNRQGTPLDNEELVYSMIKAYWPTVEDIMRGLPSHTTEARLIGLGVRVALTGLDSDKLVPELSVERIRSIFRPNDGKSKEAIKARADRDLIEDFFQNDKLKNALEWVDSHIRYNIDSRPYGLPAYLRSSLAWYSRDVFAWLLLLAKRYENIQLNDDLIVKKITGLALSIHWFGNDKAKSVDTLVKNHSSLHSVSISDMKDDKGRFILVPLSIKDMQDAFQLSSDSPPDQLANFRNFWEGTVHRNAIGDRYTEDEAKIRAEKYGAFIEKIQGKQELLVYEQRKYINDMFTDFDPSNKLMWKGHNRPWDYDHILASARLNAQGRGTRKYLPVCQTWQKSIGNQVAVDLFFNRSKQDGNASDKYENYGAFDMNLDDAENIERTKQFILGAKDRLIATYREWYEGLEIESYSVS